METIYLIQDIRTREYYGMYSGSQYFNTNINDAINYSSEGESLSDLSNIDLKDFFFGKTIEIKKYLIIA